jgi:hypothetical protein
MGRTERVVPAGLGAKGESDESGIPLIILDKQYSGVVSIHSIAISLHRANKLAG